MAPRVATLATCSLNQWALDFEGNLARIAESIARARAAGAAYRVGPELEIPGYGCEDHFLELDTVQHSWEVLAALLAGGHTDGLLCDFGMPVIHRGVAYNCRVLALDGRILLIRPKLALANDGNYRETRYFSTWKRRGQLEDHPLPPEARAAAKGGQAAVPFGDGILQLADATLAAESCEELFTPDAPHIGLALAGVDVIANGSGSHHALRKLRARLDLILGATAKGGGVYLYANQRGCDGGRLYYDGCACVASNGSLVAMGAQFGVGDVEVVPATVDLDEVVSYRLGLASLREQASAAPAPAVVQVPGFALCRSGGGSGSGGNGAARLSLPMEPRIHAPEEEIALGPAAWLWDYLRRSGAAGYLLPLSGGADSSATAAIVGSMCQMVVRAVAAGDAAVERDARRLARLAPGEPLGDARALAGRLLTTVYMGSDNSSAETRARAALLASQIGARHTALAIDAVTTALRTLFELATGRAPRFCADGGSTAENLALQNIQARARMVVAFMMAQLLPWARGEGGGWLLVLGSANVDEALRGYLTKYDCSAADINPIGGISKGDLKRFLRWGATALGYPCLADVAAAAPTAELEPLRCADCEGQPPQTDEVDMGMTYDELGVYGRLRKVARAGPVAAYRACRALWRGTLTAREVAAKVQHFFRAYAANRHKATVLPPAYHAEAYSPDDNRFDHRPFLYDITWRWQFARMDALAAAEEEERDG